MERAVLAVTFHRPAQQEQTEGWEWVRRPQGDLAESGIWVIDGSRRYGGDWTTARTGCGVAVISDEGDLLGFAFATPPPWVRTAPMA